jgi:hypothetical protein
MAKRYRSVVAGAGAVASCLWSGSLAVAASASPPGGLLNDSPVQVPSWLLLLLLLVLFGATGAFLLFAHRSERLAQAWKRGDRRFGALRAGLTHQPSP